MNQTTPGEKLEKRLWSTYGKFGKCLTIVAAYCIADKITQMATGNHIHEYLGITFNDPEVMIKGIKTNAIETGRQWIITSAVIYGAIKRWL